MSDKHKLVPVEPTEHMLDSGQCASFRDIETQDAVRIYEAMLAAAPEVEQEPVAFCEDAALSIAERTFSTEVDEQLASDIIQYAQRLHSLYAVPQTAEHHPECGCCGQTDRCDDDCDAAPQPAPDVAGLVEALEEGLRAIGDHHAPDDCYATGPMTGDPFRDLVQCPACSFIAMCDDALAAHRKGGEA